MERLGLLALFMLAGTVAPLWGAADAPVRDALGTAFDHPFLTDADLGAYLTDTHAIVLADGGPVLIRYPGATGVQVDGQVVPAASVGPDLLRVEVPARRHHVLVLTEGDGAPPVALPPTPGAVRTPEEFEERVAELAPGDELVIADGVYSAWQATIAAVGSAAEPIVIRAETPGGAVFTGDTRLRVTGQFVTLKGVRFEHCGPGMTVEIRGGSDNRLTQCQFIGCGNPRNTFMHILRVGVASSRNRVDHCYFTSSQSISLGLRVRGDAAVPQDNRFDHNVFRDIYRYWSNGQENIQLGGGQPLDVPILPRTVVELNLFDHAWGDSEIISNKSWSNIIRHNVAAHCHGSAFTLRGGDEVRFEGNVMVDNHSGLRVMGRRHTIINNVILDQLVAGIVLETGNADGRSQVATEGTLIAHNTIVNCGGGAIIGGAASEDRPFVPTDLTIANNLLAGGAGTLLDTQHWRDARVLHNLYHGASSGDTGEGAVLGAPALEGEGSSLRPAPGSPAIDAAVALEALATDRWGRERGQRPDIGADEIGAVDADGGAPLLPELPVPSLFSPALYTREAVFDQDASAPLRGWRAAGDVSAEDDALVLKDSTVRPDVVAPEDVVLSWEYHPHEFTSVAAVDFAQDEAGNGYRLSWGGVADDGKPSGIIRLSRTGSDTIVAQTSDIAMYYQTYRLASYGGSALTATEPRPDMWYRFTLIRNGPTVVVMMRRGSKADAPLIPVLIWRDRGAADGSIATGAGLSVAQTGTGSWRRFGVFGCGYTGDVPPDAPGELAATAHGGSRVALTWRDGRTGQAGYVHDLYRSTDADFEPSADNLIAAGIPGTGDDDFAVEPGTSYVYKVRARNQLGLGSAFSVVTATTEAGGPMYRVIPASEVQDARAPLELVTDEAGETVLRTSPGSGFSLKGPPEIGNADWPFEVEREGQYALWGLARADSGSSDSFWVKLDDATESPYRGWGTGVHATWTWGHIPGDTRLEAGRHVLHLRHREPGPQVKALLVTDDMTFRPAGQ